MSRFHTVKLEIIRPGPAHNQLLSPVTLYIALCGNESPVTFHIELEHHKLLTGLERLRYVTPDGSGFAVVPDPMREAAVREVGEEVARIFSDIPTLLAEISRARGEANRRIDETGSHLVHLSLVLGGSELSLIPFEMAFSPQSFPGEGLEFFLQVDMGAVVTRETRRTRSPSVAWDQRVPTILMIAAMPAGLDVPLDEHVEVLRAAIGPWVRWRDSAAGQGPLPEQQPLANVRERLRLLVNPSIAEIYDVCSRQQFSHIHILAHGDVYDVAGERRFGVVLCEDGNPMQKQVVSGKRLANALQAEDQSGMQRSCPLLVTLTICDSGNPGSVLVPGGSIAHDLHSSGIPWVFAFQFPVTKAGSVRFVQALYPRLLRGDDPRQVLFELRRHLFMRAERDHDWASIVVYTAISNDFEEQVANFFERQTKLAIDLGLERLEYTQDSATRDDVVRALTGYFALWHSRLRTGNELNDRLHRADYYGLHGSFLKRIALRQYVDRERRLGEETLERSFDSYRKAMKEYAIEELTIDNSKYHWLATQALSIGAVTGAPRNAGAFDLAYGLASRDLSNTDGSVQAWAHGTLAELELLRAYHRPASIITPEEVAHCIRAHCRAIIELKGEESFHVRSTARQFKRYIDFWPAFSALAKIALDALGENDSVQSS